MPSSSTLSEPAKSLVRAVVDNGHERLGHLFADHGRVGGDAFAVEIRLHAVADGLVQQDSRDAGAQHDGHFARRRLHGLEQDQGPIDRRLGDLLDEGRGVGGEVLAAAEIPGGPLVLAVFGGHGQLADR